MELTDFVNRELDLLDRKNKSKSKAQIAAEKETFVLTDNIVELFSDNATVIYTATEVANAMKVTVQKVTSILTKLVNEEILVRNVSKGKANFTFKAEV